jgi:hypothetical protein
MAMDFPEMKWTGDITAFTTQDPDINPNTVLDIDQDWKLKVEWNVTGPSAGLITNGTWHIFVKIESLGPEEEKILLDIDKLASDKLPISNWNDMRYSHEVTVKARNPDGNPPLDNRVNQEGVYKLVVVLSYTDGYYNKPRKLTGFLEGPVLQFYHFEP